MHQDDSTDDGLHALTERLRDEKAGLTALERDAVKQRVKRRAVRSSTSHPFGKAPLLKSRLTLTLVLATGLMMTGTGATLAVTGIAGDNDASVAQYGGGKPKPGEKPEQGEVLGDNGQGGGGGDDGDEGAVLGDDAQGGAPGAGEVAGDGNSFGDQVEVANSGQSDTLPFTGLAVFPLLLGGIALATTGGVLRRRLDRQS